jgi:hypothetical protein
MAGVITWAELPGQFDAYLEMTDCRNRSPGPFAFLIRRVKNAAVYGSPDVSADQVGGTSLYCHEYGNEAVIYTVDDLTAPDGTVIGADVTVLGVIVSAGIPQFIAVTAPARFAAI